MSILDDQDFTWVMVGIIALCVVVAHAAANILKGAL